jgi:pyrimidine operon attenuation protein/uracil phosphoribosyltransferase
MAEKLYDANWIAQVIGQFAAAVEQQAQADKDAGAPMPVLAGLRTRGAHLAERVAKRLKDDSDLDVPVAHLDVTFYRDDLDRRPVQLSHGTDMNESIDERTVILIDDVLHTGRTIRAAMDLLMDFGRPARIRLFSVVERADTRELPIAPDQVGARVGEDGTVATVRVRLQEEDGVDEVVLENAGE